MRNTYIIIAELFGIESNTGFKGTVHIFNSFF